MKRNPPDFQVDRAKCLRCGLCIRDCVVKVLRPGDDGVPRMAPEDEPFCIRCRHCFAVCPAGAVSLFGQRPENARHPSALPEPERMEALIRQRRSIRMYRPEPLEREILDRLADSHRWSPTGCNDHRLFFRLVDSPAEMAVFRERTADFLKFLMRTGVMRLVYPKYKRYLSELTEGSDVIFRSAPHMIVAASPRSAPCRTADPWIALTQFDLLAQSFGVGTCWCGFACYVFRFHRGLRSMLGLPSGYRVGAVLLFGRPAVTYPRVPEPDEVLFP